MALFFKFQRATFLYLDAQPQWTYFNRGSWQRLEENLRDAVEKRLYSQIEVYTGVSGHLCLPKAAGNIGPNCCFSSLWSDDRLPVPGCFWKLIKDEDTGCGVVIYGYNNPFNEEFYDSSEEYSSSSSSSSYDEDDFDAVGALPPPCICPYGQRIDRHFLIDGAPGLSGCTVEGARGFQGFPQDASASCILRCF